jgi:hypothetical protein
MVLSPTSIFPISCIRTRLSVRTVVGAGQYYTDVTLFGDDHHEDGRVFGNALPGSIILMSHYYYQTIVNDNSYQLRAKNVCVLQQTHPLG